MLPPPPQGETDGHAQDCGRKEGGRKEQRPTFVQRSVSAPLMQEEEEGEIMGWWEEAEEKFKVLSFPKPKNAEGRGRIEE